MSTIEPSERPTSTGQPARPAATEAVEEKGWGPAPAPGKAAEEEEDEDDAGEW